MTQESLPKYAVHFIHSKTVGTIPKKKMEK